MGFNPFDNFGLFSGGDDPAPVNTTDPWLKKLQAQLGDWSSKGIDAFTPGEAYAGNLNFAGKPTGQEQTSLDMLTKFLGDPGTGSLFDQGSRQISDTLSGKFADPASSPFIQAMMKLSNNNLQDQITQERGTRGARGTYYTDAGIQAEGKLRGRTLDNLNAIIGQFTQQERQNMLGAANTAKEFDQYKNLTNPLAKIQAGQTYGSLSRTIEQANLESQYQDYLRQRTEKQLPIKTALALSLGQQDITPGVMTPPKNDMLGNIASLAPLISSFLPGGIGGIAGLLGGGGGGSKSPASSSFSSAIANAIGGY